MDSHRSFPVLEQPEKGYRFSMEPFLLGAYPKMRSGMNVLDVGCGNGIISILLHVREPLANITAIEIHNGLHEIAWNNLIENGLDSSINLILGDIMDLNTELQPYRFDLIISNPPYRKKDSGRINRNPVKAVARHELKLNLKTLAKRIRTLLKPGGSVVLSYPANRMEEVKSRLEENSLIPLRLRRVYGYPGSACKWFLIEAQRDIPEISCEEDSFCIFQKNGKYSNEMEKIYADFNYSSRSHRIRKK